MPGVCFTPGSSDHAGGSCAPAILSTCGQAARLDRVACRSDVTDLRERDRRGTVGRGCRLGPRAISICPPPTVPLRRRVRRCLEREAATGETASQGRGQAAAFDTALDRARRHLWLSAGQLHPWPLRDPVWSLSDQAKPVGRRLRLLAWPQAWHLLQSARASTHAADMAVRPPLPNS